MNKAETQKFAFKKIFKLLFTIGFCLSNIFLFAPITIYQGNLAEFAIPLSSVLISFFFPAILVFFLLFIVGLFITKKFFDLYIIILLTLGILVWLQGNIFVWKYGLLDGQGIDWSRGNWRGWFDGAIWICLLIVAGFQSKKLLKMAFIVSIALFFSQLAFSIFTSFEKPEIWKPKQRFSLPLTPPKEIFEFSKKQNIINIVLDAFQSDTFQEIIDDGESHYYKRLEGFTFFKENTGSFPTTYMSIPVILSGKIYKNDKPISDFLKETFQGATIPTVFYENRYEVDLVFGMTNGIYPISKYSTKYVIPIPYGVSRLQHIINNSALMLDIVMFRSTPHFLKKMIYNEQLWRISQIFNQEKKLRYFSHEAFFKDLIDNLVISRNRPVYKYIHLEAAHPPFVVNNDCEYAGKALSNNRENLKIQAKCSLDQTITFLENLKSKRVYDSSLIIINADHGQGKKVKMKNMGSMVDEDRFDKIEQIPSIAGSAIPLVAIKPPFSKGPLKISNAQTTLADIPATITSIIKLKNTFDGKSMFEIKSNEIRERKFFFYRWLHENWQADYFDRLDEFIINGSVFDANAWRIGSTYFSPKSSFRTYKIDFGTNQANRFLRFGWGSNEKDTKENLSFNWALGESASVLMSFPRDRAVVLTANIKPYLFAKPQIITIKVDDKLIGIWKPSNKWEWQQHRIVIPPDKARSDISVVEFMFSQHLTSKKGVKDVRPLAVLFESITLNQSE